MGSTARSNVTKLKRRLLAAARRFHRDRRGASAIEFVLIFPIMVILLAGTVDLSQALLASRKMNQLTATIGDMISQKSNWTTADVGAIMAGASTIIEPFNSDNLTIQLAVVDVGPDLTAKVNWSQAFKTKLLQKGAESPVAIPVSIAENGVQLITVNATFLLTTPFSSLLKPITGVATYSYNRNYIMRPRIKDSVTLKN
ncbi:pilus assembly protein [Agrobacterium tumefaciens]|uniref:TadE/TadG family type IV pilus assembly protein n=1 Tax=Agrobacterium tumefaciens TaxID=358 RepID=UPI00157491F7|nr:TadE/TadG family type IV pilus assembly protein [Agrobacterium tumefaciens]MCZ7497330.1 pilus assembly protein [Rhizobium rhizogenes]NTE56544.1 pilus assembly protein [Agrobacterium tumefaciens]NTE74512.1 pilus assembly protein [Agrobacterium tumefaciens]